MQASVQLWLKRAALIVCLSCGVAHPQSATSQPAAQPVREATGTRLIPSPVGWTHPNVRLVALSNGDAVVIRCGGRSADCFRSGATRTELTLLSNGRPLRIDGTIAALQDGGVKVLDAGIQLGVSVAPEDNGILVKLPSGKQLTLIDLFSAVYYPGCIGGLAPKQLIAGRDRFAFFRLGTIIRHLETREICTLDEMPQHASTVIEQIFPDTVHSFERADGVLFVPIPGGHVVELHSNSGSVSAIGMGLYVVDLTGRPEDDWKTLPALTGMPSGKRIDFKLAFEKLGSKFLQMSEGGGKK